MKKLEGIKAVVIDYGGTLDTNGCHWYNLLWEAWQKVGIPVQEDQFRTAYVFGERALAKAPIVKKDDDFRSMLLKKVEQEIAWLEFKKEIKISGLQHESYLYDIVKYCNERVLETLKITRPVAKALKEKYPLVLVSNFYGNLHKVLEVYELPYFDNVIESSVVGVRKPDPAIYQLGVDATGFKAEEVAVVGDNFRKDILPAKSLGCKTIWLKGNGWKEDEAPDENIPDVIISDLRELQEVLL